ncbi:hypothetical protein LIER_24968 [Lithospermum erythrorhizon]|uniref:Transcription repressor n=1 Tax=Lithospermum erythrorhizon TaxID=34254 RepID=A0AAV3R6R4_LITER
MAKKMKFPFIFKNKENKNAQQWQWPSCKHPKTLSFRAGDDIFKTVNSVFFDSSEHGIETPETWFSNSITSESASISTESEEYYNMGAGAQSLETIIKGVQSSERLFFTPEDTSSIAGEVKGEDEEVSGSSPLKDEEVLPFEGSVMMAMDSENPYEDFKKSMQEMIESKGLKDWECLEELLRWYLRMNEEKHHEFIIEAFIDMLIGFSAASSSSSLDSTSFISAESCLSSPSSSSSSLSTIGQGQREVD